jgi:hypothetical protein
MNVADADHGANAIRAAMERTAIVGLGLGVPGGFAANGHRNRPAQLTLSPSDSNLVGSKAIGGDIPEETDEERAVASEVCDLVYQPYCCLRISTFSHRTKLVILSTNVAC